MIDSGRLSYMGEALRALLVLEVRGSCSGSAAVALCDAHTMRMACDTSCYTHNQAVLPGIATTQHRFGSFFCAAALHTVHPGRQHELASTLLTGWPLPSAPSQTCWRSCVVLAPAGTSCPPGVVFAPRSSPQSPVRGLPGTAL
jgi:hypothetical protein